MSVLFLLTLPFIQTMITLCHEEGEDKMTFREVRGSVRVLREGRAYCVIL